MTDMRSTCRRCGAQLAAPDDPCPACLYRAALAFKTDTEGEGTGSSPADTTWTPPPADAPPRATATAVEASPDTIGPYRILRPLGEGGMGVVYLAEQREPLRRQVALKVIKLGMDTRAVVARFEAERQALAVMDHPNIAAVFDAGATDDGRPYFVMEYVAGVPITEYCDAERLATRARLALFVQVCHAIQHAHQKGVIHRDIKPSNVLVTVHDGQPTPKVIDFGVAKATESSMAVITFFTQHGQLVGTPEYMSPEQADRAQTDVDATTDIYSLGVVLYELLVGALPFDPVAFRQAGMHEMLRIVCEDDPPRPSTRLSTLGDAATEVATRRRTEVGALRRELAGDLDWIVLRAMEKDRTRRYPSASELAADIGRYLRVEPVLASPPSLTYRARKFVRRHQLGVASAFVVLLALLGASVVSTMMYLRAERARREADEQRQAANRGRLEADAQRRRAENETRAAIAAQQKADERGKEAEYQAYTATISAANSELRSGASQSVRERLNALPEALRRWEWGFLAFSADPSLQTTTLIADDAIFADPDANDLLVSTVDGTRLLLKGRRHVHTVGAISATRAASYAARGPVLAVGQGGSALAIDRVGAPWTVQLIDVATGRIQRSIETEGYPECAAISADNSRAVIGDRRGTSTIATVWDARSGARLSSMVLPEPPSRTPPLPPLPCLVALSADGSIVLSSRGTLAAWNSSTGASIPIVGSTASKLPSNPLGTALSRFAPIAFSAGGTRAAIGHANGVAVLDLTARPMSVRTVPVSLARALALSANGERLAVSTASRVDLWSLSALPARLSSFTHDTTVTGLAFSGDTRLQGLCENGQLRTWGVPYMTATTTLEDARTPVGVGVAQSNLDRLVAVSPSGRLVAAANMNGSVSLWRLGDATLVAHWAVPEDMLKAAPLGSPLRLPMPQAAVRSLSFSGDERALALGYANGTIGIRRVPSGETVREIKAHTNSVMPMETSRDGRWLATASQDGLVRVWDWATGALQAVFASPNKAGVHPSLAFRPDNSLVVGNVPIYTRPTQPFAFLWDWRSNRTVSSVVIRSITPSLGMSIAINPVDGRIAMGGGGVGSAVSIWDPELRRETGRLVGTARPVTSLDFSPDGERLVTAGDGVRVWSTDRLELLAMLDVPGDFVQFTRDGRRLIAGSTRISVLDSRAPSSPIRQLVLNPRTPPNTVRVSPRPNLSGTWVLAEIVGEPSFPGAPAKALEIAQTPETLDVADATAVASYRLDGTESIIRQPTKDGVADQVARATVEPDAIVTIVSTASGEHRLRYYLDGDQLVIEGDGGKRVYRRGR